MAGTNSTVDGMGFEEANQETTSTEVISGTNIYGTTGSFDQGYIEQDLEVGDAIECRTLQVNDREIFSTAIENAAEVYGQRVKAGSIVIGNSASGLVNFKTPFTSANYFMFATPRELTAPGFSVTGSQGRAYCVSGAYRASGCWLYGGSTTVVNWLAVGI